LEGKTCHLFIDILSVEWHLSPWCHFEGRAFYSMDGISSIEWNFEVMIFHLFNDLWKFDIWLIEWHLQGLTFCSLDNILWKVLSISRQIKGMTFGVLDGIWMAWHFCRLKSIRKSTKRQSFVKKVLRNDVTDRTVKILMKNFQKFDSVIRINSRVNLVMVSVA